LSLSYAVTQTPTETTLSLLGLPMPVPQPAVTVDVFVIENALLTTTGVAWLSGAMVLTDRQATAGLLVAGLPLLDLLPTLPDPYVSNDRLVQRPNLNAGCWRKSAGPPLQRQGSGSPCCHPRQVLRVLHRAGAPAISAIFPA